MSDQFKIIGTWVLVDSEISTLLAGCEVYVFRQNGRLDMYYSDECGGSGVTKLFYELSGELIRFGFRRDFGAKVEVYYQGDLLILLGDHGMESYFKRLAIGNAPEWFFPY